MRNFIDLKNYPYPKPGLDTHIGLLWMHFTAVCFD